ncbi:hypothetical protein RI367_006457 [Sorochytrium milnesiophthora]
MTSDSVTTVATAYGAYVLLFAGAAVVLWRGAQSRKEARRLPPAAPKCYPIIGHLGLAAGGKKNVHNELATLLRDTYKDPATMPDVVTCYLGRPVVVLCTRKAIQEAFIGNAKAVVDRPLTALLDYMNDIAPTILVAPYGEHWRRMRTALHKVLTPKNVVERMNLEPETRAFLKEMWRVQQTAGEVPVKTLTQFVAFNVIFSTAFGRRFESIDDPELQHWTEVVDELLFVAGQPTLQDMFPRLARLLPARLRTGQYRRRLQESKEAQQVLLAGEIARLRKELEDDSVDPDELPPSHIRDLIRMQSTLQLSDTDVASVASSMINGGLETSSTTAQWLIGQLVNQPELQHRAFAELDAVCSSENRLPNLNDPLPFCYALIKETLRLRPPAEIIARQSVEPFTVCGHHIPPNTAVIANLISSYGRGVDPVFNPDRWLGDSQGKDAHLGDFLKDMFSFGGGRRICPGINLAYQELFMVLTRLLATFELSLPAGVERLDLVPRYGITISPEAFNVRVALRKGRSVE